MAKLRQVGDLILNTDYVVAVRRIQDGRGVTVVTLNYADRKLGTVTYF